MEAKAMPAIVSPPSAMQAVAPQSEVGAIISMIERVARDPSVDIERLERLLQLRERVGAEQAKKAYAAALAEMQSELPVIAERGKIDIGRGKPQQYALWEDINEAIKPVMSAHGFSLQFKTGRTEAHIVVTGILRHREGHSEETTMHLPLDQSGSKNAVQAVGSSTSYGKRYTASALLNLTSRGEDDDGKAAGGAINAEQAEKIRQLSESLDSEAMQGFLKYLGVDGIETIPAEKYDKAIYALGLKKGQSK